MHRKHAMRLMRVRSGQAVMAFVAHARHAGPSRKAPRGACRAARRVVGVDAPAAVGQFALDGCPTSTKKPAASCGKATQRGCTSWRAVASYGLKGSAGAGVCRVCKTTWARCRRVSDSKAHREPNQRKTKGHEREAGTRFAHRENEPCGECRKGRRTGRRRRLKKPETTATCASTAPPGGI